MKNICFVLFIWSVIILLTATLSNANSMQIKVSDDASIYSDEIQANYPLGSYGYLNTGGWDNDSTYYSLFKFDLTELTNQLNSGDILDINSITFYSYPIGNHGNAVPSNGLIAIGNNDNWSETDVTWNSYISYVGSQIASASLTPNMVGWVSWDLTGTFNNNEFLSDSLVTLVLYADSIGLNGLYHFASKETWPLDDYYSYLDIDYTIQPGGSAPVPEPATMLLFGTGLAGLAGLRRRRS